MESTRGTCAQSVRQPNKGRHRQCKAGTHSLTHREVCLEFVGSVYQLRTWLLRTKWNINDALRDWVSRFHTAASNSTTTMMGEQRTFKPKNMKISQQSFHLAPRSFPIQIMNKTRENSAVNDDISKLTCVVKTGTPDRSITGSWMGYVTCETA